MVEHTAVNRGVVGSSPTRGVKGKRDIRRMSFYLSKKPVDISVCGFSLFKDSASKEAP